MSEEVVTRRDLDRVREAFLTNSLLEVMPLISLDGAPIGAGRPGEVTRRLRQAYRGYVQHALQNPPEIISVSLQENPPL